MTQTNLETQELKNSTTMENNLQTQQLNNSTHNKFLLSFLPGTCDKAVNRLSN